MPTVPALRTWLAAPWRTTTAGRDIPVGLVAGVAVPSLILSVLWAGGWQRVAWHGLTVTQLLTTIVTGALVGPVLEEVAFRYLALRGLERLTGPAAAAVVTAVAFGVLHLVSPYGTTLGGIAATAAGLMFGGAYLATRTMWLPIALHIGWNLVTVVAVGVPVAGAHRLFHLSPQGPEVLSGGTFGPDASILTVAACLALGVALLARRQGVPRPEKQKQPSL